MYFVLKKTNMCNYVIKGNHGTRKFYDQDPAGFVYPEMSHEFKYLLHITDKCNAVKKDFFS